jgi:hypothetical protein
MAVSSSTSNQLFQLIGWDQWMPKRAARFKQATCDGAAYRDGRNPDDLGRLVNFVGYARQRFFRSVPVMLMC